NDQPGHVPWEGSTMYIIGSGNPAAKRVRDLATGREFELWAEGGDIYMKCLDNGAQKKFASDREVAFYIDNYTKAREVARKRIDDPETEEPIKEIMRMKVEEYTNILDAMKAVVAESEKQGSAWKPDVQADRAKEAAALHRGRLAGKGYSS